MRVSGTGRKLVALAGLAVLAALMWTTIGPGRVRLVGMIILGGFALRIVLTQKQAQGGEDEAQAEEGSQEIAGRLPGQIQNPAEQGHRV